MSTDTLHNINPLRGVDPEIAHRHIKEIDAEILASATRTSITTDEAMHMAKRMITGLTDNHPEFNTAMCQAVQAYFAMKNSLDNDE